MRSSRNGLLPCIVAIAVAIVAFNGSAFAQNSVTIAGVPTPGPTPIVAPTDPFTVTATATGNPTKVVFYRNDVPVGTSTAAPYLFEQDLLGQDTYTFRARAYYGSNNWVDSTDVDLIVNTYQVIKMGDPNGPVPTKTPSIIEDHTTGIQNAVTWLGNHGGGTLFFPCTLGPGDGISRYNIRDTITIPGNVTLQGESSEYGGRCQIIWRDVSWNPPYIPPPPPPAPPPVPDPNCQDGPEGSPNVLLRKPMFKIEGNTSHTRLKDMWLHSMSSGPHCWARSDPERIATEKTTAIALDGHAGNIDDVILENVGISNFTYGIKATTCVVDPATLECIAETDNKLFGIKIRGITPIGNHRQLYVNAKYAYDWDVQNFNIMSMTLGQGAIEIMNAGTPPEYQGANNGLKFLQLNCNGDKGPINPAFCVRVQKHDGLYFKQLHHEGAGPAIIVENISPQTNDESIIFEGSVATGEFNDASMKLYLIGNSIAAVPLQVIHFDHALRFYGDALSSTVVDCGDMHVDGTDTDAPGDPGNPGWGDLRMLYTHSERNRGSLFFEDKGYSFVKSHKYCPANVPNVPNINEVGGEYFDSGIMPTYFPNTDPPYTHVLQNTIICPPGCNATTELETLLQAANGGTVYIDGSFTIDRTLTIPSGRQIVGAPGAVLELITSNASLFRINAPVWIRTSGVTIRNLEMSTTDTTETTETTAIEVIGHTLDHQGTTIVGLLSDMHFSGLKISGFTKGIAADPTQKNPMLDGVSMKNMTFVNNLTAVENRSPNNSNWNIMNFAVESNSPGAMGWYLRTGGNSLQNVTCQGTQEDPMEHCIRMDMASTYITGLKETKDVINALTIGPNGSPFDGIHYFAPQTSNLFIRDSNFGTSVENMATVNIIGRANIVSMNNTYGYFNVHQTYEGIDYQGRISRLTHCGDTYGATPDPSYPKKPYHGLDEKHKNLYVGVLTPTRQECGARPVPWEDAVSWGGEQKPQPPTGEAPPEYFENDKPMVGSFFDNDAKPNVSEDLVIYREGTATEPQSKFLIKKVNGPESLSVNWGQFGDKPLIGRFFANSHDRIAIWRPSNGQWWIRDPHKPDNDPSGIVVWQWGIDGDVPFVGNFDSDPEDEIAVYRPTDGVIYILEDPSTGAYRTVLAGIHGGNIQVGDFQGLGFDQIAQYQNGIWYIVNPETGTPSQISFGATDDVPVAGKYLPKAFPTQQFACAQLGVWRPGNPGKFIVRDAFPECGGRGYEPNPIISMEWGSNNELVGAPPSCKDGASPTPCKDDIPLVINNATGTLDRPTAYRPTKGAYEYSIANGQWWIHDAFAP